MQQHPTDTSTSQWRGPLSTIRSFFDGSRRRLGRATGAGSMLSGLFASPDEEAEATASDVDRAPLWLLKLEMVKVLEDCPLDIRNRICTSITRCRSGMELWMMRSGIFQAVAVVCGEHHARERINNLLPFFVDWVPEKQRVAI